jgi:hypothetical protein
MQNRDEARGGAVFVQTNEVDGNRVIAFRRGPAGELSRLRARRRAAGVTACPT